MPVLLLAAETLALIEAQALPGYTSRRTARLSTDGLYEVRVDDEVFDPQLARDRLSRPLPQSPVARKWRQRASGERAISLPPGPSGRRWAGRRASAAGTAG